MAHVKKALSLILCAALTAGLAACGTTKEASAIDEEKEQDMLTQMLGNQVAASHSSEAGKEETVYVMADASGAVNKIIVSDWIKNADGDGTLADVSDLQDIRNVKGYEEFTQAEGGNLIWQAEGADIYYQGTTDKELPVDVRITYTLEGEEIAPENLAGKSGRVTIRFDYENRQKETVEINGKEEEIYIPFAMISGMVLPEENFSNIEVKNARLISEGNNSLIVGVAFPGLKESLNVERLREELEKEEKTQEAEALEIPEYIEVSADAKDFALNMTMTMAMSDVLSDIALTDSIDLTDINSSMDDLQSASKELKGGTSDLKNGTSELKDGTAELLDGVLELTNGTADLREGTGTLVSGAGALKEGADILKGGTQKLYDKSGELNAGAGKLYNGAAELEAGSKELAAGTKQLAAGSIQLNEGMSQLQSGLSSADSGVKAMLMACEGSAQTPGLVSGTQSLTEGIAGLDTLLNQYFSVYEKEMNDKIIMLQNMKAAAEAEAAGAEKKLAGAQNAMQAAEAALNEACVPENKIVEVETVAEINKLSAETVSGGISICSTEPVEVTAAVPIESISAEAVMKAAADYKEAGEQAAAYQAEVMAARARADAAQELLAKMAAGYTGSGLFDKEGDAVQAAYITYIKEASANLAKGSQTINAGVGALYGGLKQLNNEALLPLTEGAEVLKQGTEAAVSGAKALDEGAVKLDMGVGTLKAGTAELKEGTEKLTEGVSTLNNGAGDLKEGAGKLNDGAGELNAGAVKLDDGAIELNDGAVKLDDGAGKLDNGALELMEGMFRFDEEGISRLTDLFGDNVQEIVDRIDAVKDAGSKYNTFTKLPEGTTGSVRFIYKTDAVKADRKS